MTNVQEVQRLSHIVLTSMVAVGADATPDVAIVALIDVAVRFLRVTNAGLDVTGACRELVQIVNKIGQAERGAAAGPDVPCPVCGLALKFQGGIGRCPRGHDL